jgi:hypothetical protein
VTERAPGTGSCRSAVLALTAATTFEQTVRTARLLATEIDRMGPKTRVYILVCMRQGVRLMQPRPDPRTSLTRVHRGNEFQDASRR